MEKKAPIQQQFLLVIILMLLYAILTKLPFAEAKVAGTINGKKIIKIFLGLAFVVGTWWIYFTQKPKKDA